MAKSANQKLKIVYLMRILLEQTDETGLTIKQPILKGIDHWYRDGLHNVGLLYRADSYEGELKSSEEGQVYWISREEYEKKDFVTVRGKVFRRLS